MRLHDLKPAPGSRHRRDRVGRGTAGKRGRYAGRGIKGQGSRTGGGMRQYFEGGQLPMVRRLPFKRGFNNPFRVDYQEVNLWLLERIFEEGATVNPQTMAAAGIIRDAANPIAVLGAGAEKLTKKLNITATRFSASAKARVEALGGTIEIIPIRIRGIHARVRKLRQYREDELYGKVE